MKNTKTLPKTRPLTGALIPEFKRCGKKNCRCASGQREDLHGPYFYRFYRVGGRLRRQYVPRNEAAEVKIACDAAREKRARGRRAFREIMQTFSEMGRYIRALREMA